MKQINIKQVQLAHFRSFVEPTAIDLSSLPGLKLISGDNQVEERLGANGAGKSSIWDAVCFCLYGTSVKGLRTSDLISYGQTSTEVALVIDIDGEEHYIHRTAPPARIYIDQEQVEQAELDQAIGLSRSRFLNSVLFGQAVPLFLDLPAPLRGDLLDEVLDLELWMLAAKKASDKHSAVSRELATLRNSISRLQGNLEGLQGISIADEERGWEADRQARLESLIAQFEAAEQEFDQLDSERQAPLELVDEEEAKRQYQVMQEQVVLFRQRRAALEAELAPIAEQIRFFSENDVCPVCAQEITAETVAEHLKEERLRQREKSSELEIVLVDIETGSSQANALQLTWQEAVRLNSAKRQEREFLNARAQEKSRLMSLLEQQATDLHAQVNPFTERREQLERDIVAAETLLEEQLEQERNHVSKLASLDYWREGFKRVRLFCLERVLTELSIETRNSLLALGLADWYITFKTATETKSGTVKLGVQAEIQSPESGSKFDMLSGGESQRARLAVSFGLANLIQRWAGVRFGLEVFDEPTAWLSEQGVEDLLEALRSRAEMNNRSIWLCDHRALYASGFTEQIKIIKDRAGSRVET